VRDKENEIGPSDDQDQEDKPGAIREEGDDEEEEDGNREEAEPGVDPKVDHCIHAIITATHRQTGATICQYSTNSIVCDAGARRAGGLGWHLPRVSVRSNYSTYVHIW